jgi:hypothetical protein
VLLELAKPFALILCIAVLGGVFYTAFLIPAVDLQENLWDTLTLLSLAAGICGASGMLFRDQTGEGSALLRTLPVQLFLWAVGVMAVMFVSAWFLETHFILYRNVHWY